MNAPLFNTDVALFASLRQSVVAGATQLNFLTVSDGHVVKHTAGRPDCVARFENDVDAQRTLGAAGWLVRGNRYFAEAE